MIEVFRFQIGTYIALAALFGSLVTLKDFIDYFKYAFIITTLAFFAQVLAWSFYFHEYVAVSYAGTLKEDIFIFQNASVVGLLIFYGFVSLYVMIAAPENI